MLGYTLYDMGPFIEQHKIALLRRIPETREEFVHIMPLPLERDLQQRLQELGILTQLGKHLKKNGFGQHLDDGGLDGLYRKNAGNILLETFQRCNPLVLEKELEGGVLAIVVEPDPQTTLLDKVIVLSDLPLLQQNGLGRKDPPLLHRGVLVPKRVKVREPILEGKDQRDFFYCFTTSSPCRRITDNTRCKSGGPPALTTSAISLK
jgi:hypothetical protein